MLSKSILTRFSLWHEGLYLYML